MDNIGFYLTMDHISIFRVISERTLLGWFVFLYVEIVICWILPISISYIKKAILSTPLFSIHQTYYWIDSSEFEKKSKRKTLKRVAIQTSEGKIQSKGRQLSSERACPSQPCPDGDPLKISWSNRPILPLKLIIGF